MKENRWRHRRTFWIVIGLLLGVWILGITLLRLFEVISLPFSR